MDDDTAFGLQDSKKATSRGKAVVAAFTVIALVGVVSTNSSRSPAKATAPYTAESYDSWEAAIFERGMTSLSLPNAGSSFLKDLEHEGTLDKLLYLNHTYAFDQLKTDGKESSAQDFYYYQQGWEAQINQAYCPVASSAAVLNSLRGKITLPQDKIYTPFPWATQNQLLLNECVRENIYDIDKMEHNFWGMGLNMASEVLKCHLEDQGYTVEAHHVNPDTTTKEKVRQAIQDAVLDPEARVLINYDRGGISQGNMGHGHFSPIGAYNHKLDAFLVMDVAKYKYPPVWVPTANLFSGIGSLDFCADFKYGPLPDPSSSLEELALVIGCQPNYRGFITIKRSD